MMQLFSDELPKDNTLTNGHWEHFLKDRIFRRPYIGLSRISQPLCAE
jgi:hypothetical protein